MVSRLGGILRRTSLHDVRRNQSDSEADDKEKAQRVRAASQVLHSPQFRSSVDRSFSFKASAQQQQGVQKAKFSLELLGELFVQFSECEKILKDSSFKEIIPQTALGQRLEKLRSRLDKYKASFNEARFEIVQGDNPALDTYQRLKKDVEEVLNTARNFAKADGLLRVFEGKRFSSEEKAFDEVAAAMLFLMNNGDDLSKFREKMLYARNYFYRLQEALFKDVERSFEHLLDGINNPIRVRFYFTSKKNEIQSEYAKVIDFDTAKEFSEEGLESLNRSINEMFKIKSIGNKICYMLECCKIPTIDKEVKKDIEEAVEAFLTNFKSGDLDAQTQKIDDALRGHFEKMQKQKHDDKAFSENPNVVKLKAEWK